LYNRLAKEKKEKEDKIKKLLKEEKLRNLPI
jgi:hypothetical protein